MSTERAVLLEANINQPLLDAQRHLGALEQSASGFGGDFDLVMFEGPGGAAAAERLVTLALA